MDNEAADRIRVRAYELWIEAGSPDGREHEFWYRAEHELLSAAPELWPATSDDHDEASTVPGGPAGPGVGVLKPSSDQSQAPARTWVPAAAPMAILRATEVPQAPATSPTSANASS